MHRFILLYLLVVSVCSLAGCSNVKEQPTLDTDSFTGLESLVSGWEDRRLISTLSPQEQVPLCLFLDQVGQHSYELLETIELGDSVLYQYTIYNIMHGHKFLLELELCGDNLVDFTFSNL